MLRSVGGGHRWKRRLNCPWRTTTLQSGYQHAEMTLRGTPEEPDRTKTEEPGNDHLAAAAAKWFVRMHSDRVSESDQRGFEEWFLQDPAHHKAYAETEALWAELGNLPDPRSDLLQRGVAPFPPSGRWRQPRNRPHRRLQLGAALAASLLLLAAIGLWGEQLYDRWRADYATAVGETRSIALSDGSVVQLNTDTALAVRFSDDRRRVDLYRGEAFFTVTSDEDRPFQVDAGGGAALALGTAFNMRIAADTVAVAVSNGRVEVSFQPGRGSLGEAVVLNAGLEARYGPHGEIQTRGVDVATVTAWREGRLIFADRPLRHVVAELDRHRPGVIVVLDAAVADARFTGVLDLHDTDHALAAIGSVLPVEVRHVTPWLTLLGPGG